MPAYREAVHERCAEDGARKVCGQRDKWGQLRDKWGRLRDKWGWQREGCDEHGFCMRDSSSWHYCHQCRAMTAARTTRCALCRAGKNQTCAHCLLTRYGESIAEALADATWQCLVCRGLCDCTFCRANEGWQAPRAMCRVV
ncbi:hypothetical protein CLOP_g15512 [Closterium sp. NIES-67]|nr:hypothetical protein CLOP_g24530 [Closterium sp. NIES-67]GJP85399.1 hypothetical protein CLOP_g15512 [Closterium sp. NIES-67]